MVQLAGPWVQAGQGYTAVDQAHGFKRASLDNAQQQRQLVPLHAGGHREHEFFRLPRLLVNVQQVGVDKIRRVSGRAQGRLQGFSIELPPVTGVDIHGTHPRRGAGRVTKDVLLSIQQGVAGTLQQFIPAPKLQVTVVDIEQSYRHVRACYHLEGVLMDYQVPHQSFVGIALAVQYHALLHQL